MSPVAFGIAVADGAIGAVPGPPVAANALVASETGVAGATVEGTLEKWHHNQIFLYTITSYEIQSQSKDSVFFTDYCSLWS